MVVLKTNLTHFAFLNGFTQNTARVVVVFTVSEFTATKVWAELNERFGDFFSL